MNRDSRAIVLTFIRSNCSVSINSLQYLAFCVPRDGLSQTSEFISSAANTVRTLTGLPDTSVLDVLHSEWMRQRSCLENCLKHVGVMVDLGVGGHHGPIRLRELFPGFPPGSGGSQRQPMGVSMGSSVVGGNGSFLTIRDGMGWANGEEFSWEAMVVSGSADQLLKPWVKRCRHPCLWERAWLHSSQAGGVQMQRTTILTAGITVTK